VSDNRGVPLSVVITAGQRHESTCFEPLIEQACLGKDRWPAAIAGDRAYDLPRIRAWCIERGIEPVIPGKRLSYGRPTRVKHDAAKYRLRNAVERCIGWLKRCRRIATRSEKLAQHFLAMVKLAMIKRCLRVLGEPSDRT
jgi:transposase